MRKCLVRACLVRSLDWNFLLPWCDECTDLRDVASGLLVVVETAMQRPGP